MKYRKKPVVIDAIKLPDEITAKTADSIWDFVEQSVGLVPPIRIFSTGVEIDTLEGTMVASPGDYIIRGVKGEYYPCKPDIFAATYEAVEETSSGESDGR
jgi:hypothetical protein